MISIPTLLQRSPSDKLHKLYYVAGEMFAEKAKIFEPQILTD